MNLVKLETHTGQILRSSSEMILFLKSLYEDPRREDYDGTLPEELSDVFIDRPAPNGVDVEQAKVELASLVLGRMEDHSSTLQQESSDDIGNYDVDLRAAINLLGVMDSLVDVDPKIDSKHVSRLLFCLRSWESRVVSEKSKERELIVGLGRVLDKVEITNPHEFARVALSLGSFKLVDRLIGSGYDFNEFVSVESPGLTAGGLVASAQYGIDSEVRSKGLMRKLVLNGVDVTAVGRYGVSAMDIAEQKGGEIHSFLSAVQTAMEMNKKLEGVEEISAFDESFVI